MSPEQFEFNKENIEQRFNCIVNEERAIEVISAALNEYNNNELGFFNNKEQAEEKYINFLVEQGESKTFILNALFLISTVTFGSSSNVFFNRLSRDPEVYKKYRWLLISSEVVKSHLKNGEEKEGVEYNSAWNEFIRPFGRQGNSLEGWYHNCVVLNKEYNGDILEYFKKHNNNAKEIWDALVFWPEGKRENKEFRRLDRKLASLFLQWVGRYELYDLSNMEDFGLPVDLQICKIAIQTGIIIPTGDLYRDSLANDILVPLIVKLCKEFGWEPRQVSEALWLIGSRGCTPDQRAVAPYYTCPLKQLCKGVMHKLPADYWKFTTIEKMGKKFSPWLQDRLL
ncbi:MAG: hypothetical protein AB9915_00120 [Candidatus Dojkabacteria bacterium]